MDADTGAEERRSKRQQNFLDREIKSVTPPEIEKLPSNKLWTDDKKINIPNLKAHLTREGRLEKEDVLQMLDMVKEIMVYESNVLRIKDPVTVCGDIHGQYYDLLSLFEVGTDPANTTYLFLGDYVDRGSFSMECVLLLYAYKINRPGHFFMLRGNHECRHLTQHFTFKIECEVKYDEEVYDAVMESFDALPLAAIVNKQFFCVHGGLSPDLPTIEDINNLDRFKEPEQNGPMCDLLWADPVDPDEEPCDKPFRFNDVRGCSYMFSYDAVTAFLERNELLSVIRAHEAQSQGYRLHPKNKKTQFPTVITMFSAPNYLDAYGNKGAVLRFENNVMNIRQFNESPHPYWLPNFMDVFAWSLPFVSEKIGEVLLGLLNLCEDDAAEDKEEEESKEAKEKRKRELLAKVRSVSRMMRMFKVLREEREILAQIKALTPEKKLPPGLLQGGRTAILEALGNFQKAKEMDEENEKYPKEEETPQTKIKKKNSSANLHRLRKKNEKKIEKLHREEEENEKKYHAPTLAPDINVDQ